MSKVPSLLFDMEDTEETPQAAASFPIEIAEEDVVHRVQSLLAPWDESEYMLALHVRIARDDAGKRGHTHVGIAELADTLRKLGYPVKLRTALGGGWGGSCLRNLRHTFLAVTLAPDAPGCAPKTVLIDPKFKEQFEIAHSTARYSRILSNVPAEAVASPERITKVVESLCTEMAFAFSEIGTPLPPWRQTAAMLSKWQPRRSEEVDVTRASRSQVGTALNNASGGACQFPKVSNNVAHKLAMMGIEPAAPASPISEGLEDLDTWSTGTDEALPSPNSAGLDLSMFPREDSADCSDQSSDVPSRAVTATEDAFAVAYVSPADVMHLLNR